MQADSPNPKQLSKLTRVAEDALALLKTDRAFWDDLVERLDAVATSRVNGLAWFGGHKPQPEHLAADAIYAILSGEWGWNPVKETLFERCCKFIWSRVDRELKKSKKFRVGIEDKSADSESEFNTGHQLATPGWTESPVEALLSAENWSELINLLPAEDSEPNRLLRQLVEVSVFSSPVREEVAAGNRPRKPGWSNLELAEKLHVTVDAIENAKKRLRTILDAWLWKAFVEDLPDDGRPWRAFVDVVEGCNLHSNWKTAFAERHSMEVTQVAEMGAELINRINSWRERTLPNVGALDRAATRIAKSFNK